MQQTFQFYSLSINNIFQKHEIQKCYIGLINYIAKKKIGTSFLINLKDISNSKNITTLFNLHF